jgi:hypothetical protein
VTPADGEGPDERPADPRVRRLLRWYPPAWRERYGDEFLAMIEDTLDGRRPTLRLRLAVALAGLRERGHQTLTGKAAARRQAVVSRWLVVFLAGSIVADLPAQFRESLPTGRAWQATAALDAVAVIVVLTGLAVLAGGLVALPALVRFLRSGGWPKIRRRTAWAAVATVAASGGLAWLVVVSRAMTFAQLDRWGAYSLVVVVTTAALVAAIGLWAATTVAVAKQLKLAPSVRAVEVVLAAAITTAVLIVVPVNILWLSAIHSSVPWLLIGTTLLVMQSTLAPKTMRRAVRRGRRLRRAVSH